MEAITILTEVTSDMTVMVSTRSHEPAAAFHCGQREARKLTRMGHECQCIGVLAVQDVMTYEKETNNMLAAGFGMVKPEIRTVVGKTLHTFYKPVISPRIPEDEQE